MPTLREVRERKFLSQQELATMAKVSRGTIANIESGTYRPFPKTARFIAAALDLDPNEIDWPAKDGKADAGGE